MVRIKKCLKYYKKSEKSNFEKINKPRMDNACRFIIIFFYSYELKAILVWWDKNLIEPRNYTSAYFTLV